MRLWRLRPIHGRSELARACRCAGLVCCRRRTAEAEAAASEPDEALMPLPIMLAYHDGWLVTGRRRHVLVQTKRWRKSQQFMVLEIEERAMEWMATCPRQAGATAAPTGAYAVTRWRRATVDDLIPVEPACPSARAN